MSAARLPVSPSPGTSAHGRLVSRWTAVGATQRRAGIAGRSCRPVDDVSLAEEPLSDLPDSELREKILRHTQRGTWVALDEIDVSQMTRPYNAEVVAALATSIRAIGLQHMLTCVERDGKHVLVAGRNRLEALRIIGAEKAPCRIVDFDDTEAKSGA